jgi:DNA modification methylase
MKLGPGRRKAYDAGLKKVRRTRKGQEEANLVTCAPGETPAANRIITGDCIKTLNDGPEGWVDLVFADPPFNIGYLYHGYDDQKDVDEYVDWSEQWMRAVHRALKPSGSFYLAIGDEFAADLAVVARRKIGFHMRNWIIWHYTFGQQTKKMFAKSHTHILYFTKRKLETGPNAEMPFTFNADAIRVASARQTTYADVRANPKGKLPDDTWYLRPQEAAPHAYFEPGGDTWNVNRVCGTFKEREGWHGCQMPIGILNRIILASSNPGDVVLDPFNGSGTTVVAAALLGRQYVGIDQSSEYVKFAQDRLAHALEHASRIEQKPALVSNNGNGQHEHAMLFETAVAAANDPTRRSRVLTGTDAFGRQRVPRRGSQ